MIFHSIDYLLFFTGVICIYWTLNLRLQNILLLLASYFFYGYVHAWYCILIAATTVVDYCCARAITNQPDRKRLFLTISLATNFSILCAFKYFGFFVDNIVAAMGLVGFDMSGPVWEILLPVGISFYTFQSASYVIDVYRGKIQARRKILHYALFVAFFPQLVAGPIERAGRLLKALETPRKFNADRIRSGLFLMLWGFFKKLVIADNVATISNKALSLQDPSFPIVWGGVFAFCIQIYADFSAYTDIARGTARTLGIDICRNFNHPYIARNPSAFWSRWHISLSTWFRDYVYIPLGGNRCSEPRIMMNIMLTFLLSGLWHGANWNFIIWGAYHGILLVTWRLICKNRPRIENPSSQTVRLGQWTIMFLLVNIGWLIFREQNPAYLWQFITSNPFGVSSEEWQIGAYFFVYSAILAIPLALHCWTDRWCTGDEQWEARQQKWKWVVAQSTLAGILLIAILLLKSKNSTEFIYFQF
ncbi:MAG: MBOAT family protein [Verrucomicrobiaceae bacterium]|nr:MBOAT family protein [Verrucomicrobiaceae bacterium]